MASCRPGPPPPCRPHHLLPPPTPSHTALCAWRRRRRLQVRGKVNAITMDKCSRTGLLFDTGKRGHVRGWVCVAGWVAGWVVVGLWSARLLLS